MKFNEKTIESKEIYNGKVVNLRVDTVELPNGKTSKREIVEHPGAVAIVAVTDDDKVLMIRQFRKPCEEELWELPAGKIDPGEEPDKTAARELEEETGYSPGKLEKLISFYTSPGFADEMIHLYLAENLSQTEQSHDEDEFLSLHPMGWEEIRQLFANNELKDSKTVTGLLMAMAEKGVEI